MEEEGLVLCDSDVLIEVLDRNNAKIIDRLDSLVTQNLSISSITFTEILYGAKNKNHQRELEKQLSAFVLLELSPIIDVWHRRLILQYSLSHKLQVQDALIAATAIIQDLPLFTLNSKDFKFIKGLRLI